MADHTPAELHEVIRISNALEALTKQTITAFCRIADALEKLVPPPQFEAAIPILQTCIEKLIEHEERIDTINPCPVCEGTGAIKLSTKVGNSTVYPCPNCHGSKAQ